MSAIDGYIQQIQTAVYGEQVRSSIVNALLACYSDVTNPSLQTEAFEAALNAAYAGGILDIQTVTQMSAMTNEKIIYRYDGTEAGKNKGLYFYNGTAWVLIGSEVQEVSLASQMTDQKAIYKYIGVEPGYVTNSLYCYSGTAWVPIGSGVLEAATAAQMTNQGAIYKYTGTESGYITNALYYYNGTDWAVLASGATVDAAIEDINVQLAEVQEDVEGNLVKRVSKISDMTEFSSVYFYTGKEDGETQNTLYYYNGEKWTPINVPTVEEIPLAKIFIYGDISLMTADKNEEQYYYIFVDEDNNKQSAGYCSMKWQGQSSLTYPKKNYTAKFYYDPAYHRKEKLDFFPDELKLSKSKWVLKANWVDRSMARNIVTARLWAQMVKSRVAAPPTEIAASPNFGAINGHPIVVYVNDEFHGLYTYNIPKDEDTFGMDEDNPKHCAICGDSNASNSAAAFQAVSLGSWVVEVPDEVWPKYTETEDVDGVPTEVEYKVSDNWLTVLDFVKNSTDADFKANFNNYIDLESAIDYYILLLLDCGVDSAARNFLLYTFNGGLKWYCSMYDMDTTWGTGTNGNAVYNPTLAFPSGYLCTNSALWNRLEENFGQEIYDRWAELSGGVLSPAYIKREFELFWNLIPQADIDSDLSRWRSVNYNGRVYNYPQGTINFKTKIPEYIDARFPYVNTHMKGLRTPIPCTGLVLDKTSLSLTSGDPQTITATPTPADTTDEIVWTTSNAAVATVKDGVVYATGNGSATITATCGSISRTVSVTVSSLSFSVSLIGTGAELSPTANIAPGAEYSGTLTAEGGYLLTDVKITMAGEDITEDVYSGDEIYISYVTGNIYVTVSSEVYLDPTGLMYSLPTAISFNGRNKLDTGYRYNGESALSLVVAGELPQDIATQTELVQQQHFFGGSEVSGRNRLSMRAIYRSISAGVSGNGMQSGIPGTTGTPFILVYRYNKATGFQSVRASVNGVEVTTSSSYNSNSPAIAPRDIMTGSVYIGCRNINGTLQNFAQSGKITEFKVFERRLSDAETATYLGLPALSDIITGDMDDA